MRRSLVFALVLGSLFPLSIQSLAQDSPKDLSSKGARIFRAGSEAPLTYSSPQRPGQIVKDFLRAAGHGSDTVSTLTPEREEVSARKGVTYLRYTQKVDGMEVYGTYVKAAVNDRGELVSLIENLAKPSPAAAVPPGITDEQALRIVLHKYYPQIGGGYAVESVRGNKKFYAGGYDFRDELSVKRVLVPMANGSLRAGFLVVTWDSDNMLRHTVVDGSGRILFEELRTNSDSYNIFAIHPAASSQSIVFGPGTGNAESPSGWVSSNTTIGNNVDAYLDRDANNLPDPGGRPTDAGANFATAADQGMDPTVAQNQMVAVQNLFYTINVIHDKLYRHGFTEAAGNFQTNNFGKGGSGNDPVNAEAQDGGGTNNANFATPSDGSRPRMQMYLWTFSTPRRDGDVDSDVVYHEYGHGLTWRMIGGMSGSISGAIGEGMSDVLSILINNDDLVGEYSYNNNIRGIRRFRYENYPNTYGDLTGSSVHNDGEIYAAAIWRLWELWQDALLDQDLLFDYIVGGMNYTPSGPAMEDMRDGILAAAAGSGNECLIWEAFAQFGIGVGASARLKRGGPFGSSVVVTESFSVPPQCGGTGSTFTLSVALSTKGQPKAELTWTGGSTANVDIVRNGVVVATTANDGSHTDNLRNAGPGPFTYKVCEAGSTAVCSNEVTVNP